MEDKNDSFIPSPACRAWSKASVITSLTSIFASTAIPPAAPILLTLAAVFSANAIRLSVNERRAFKKKQTNNLDI